MVGPDDDFDLDFDLIGGDGGSGGKVLEPRKIFTTLVRQPRFKFLSDNQGEVLDKWFDKRLRSDNTIKMNTGSGKMLVGLLILRSSLNEDVGPAVYITPDKYLALQVIKEAEDLGIYVTDDPANASFLANEAILVTNIHKLFNGKSVFGVGARKIPIGAIVIDDAHACLESVSDQFRIDINSSSLAYNKLLRLFEDDLRAQSEVDLIEIKREDPQALLAVPFAAWIDKREQVLSVLHDHRNESQLQFSWPLLKDVIPLCRCVFGSGQLEIAPRCLPVDEIPSFARAKRRVYMTATLADDGILITHLDADAASVLDPIKPKGAGEIGDRMIIAPQEINEDITEEDIKGLAAEVAKKRNVVVIVPSWKRAEFWAEVAAQTLSKENIWEGVSRLKEAGTLVGLTVLVNRYDGVDLPDDACRLLIIDGLPEVAGLIERADADVVEETEMQLLTQIQKLEQGMGRGVRSGEDRCAVLLVGARLTQRVNQPGARNMFTPATLAQITMGKETTRQLKGKSIDKFRPILDLCIERDTEAGKRWWQAGRARLAKAPEGVPSHVNHAVTSVRQAFDYARKRQHSKAIDALQAAVRQEPDPIVRGYLKQQLAEHTHHIDPVHAQEILLSAVDENSRVTKPIAGISYSRISAPLGGQAIAAFKAIQERFIDLNQFVFFVNALAADLYWDKNRTDVFEAAVRDLGYVLGFGSQRPEKDYRDGGPDNLWAMGDLKFLVIECKSGVDLDGRDISKDHCNQLLGAFSWFKRSYDQSCSATPILVHPSNRFGSDSSPSAEMRIIDSECLEKLRNAIRSYAKTIAALQSLDSKSVAKQLEHYGLLANNFINKYTVSFKRAR